ncbi:hypothetical protein MSG28_014623 [Choristoneura fumiferana]|uniref:Uncharacterized protein n=1 Tax=Choristoneura fumiferana TaxID=7141 RepID=A0ACC0JS13_CHOFU|nr:hypothetical protein MSG28_014623 [Choristoneura fumiferana]
MSLITIDDDSSEDIAIISDTVVKESSEASERTLENKSTNNDTDTEDLTEVLSNSKSNDTEMLEPVQVEPDDSETIDTTENDDETREKPILELMKNLIHYNGKQNTTLTNAELIKMLKNEFHIDVPNLPLISVEIYMNVLKKFLKDWPQWDKFDQVMHEFRCMSDNDEIERMLEREYTALKEYLAAMLKASKPWARESAQKLKRSAEVPASAKAVPGDVILEVNCARSQLNTLFFRKPHPNYNYTIFNVENSVPTKINISTPSLKSILNGCYVRIHINTKCFKYKRELIHDLKHKLINKKNQKNVQETKLNQYLQTLKAPPKTDKIISNKDIKAVTEKIDFCNRYMNTGSVSTIFQIINDDINAIDGSFGIPAVFRHYMNPYAYVRYLHEPVDVESDKYDLQLEELISPRLKFQISRLSLNASAETLVPNWLKLECSVCEVTFLGITGVEQLIEHFRDNHQNEPDLTCTNCDKTFSVNELALTRWYHKCEKAILFNSDTE